MSIRAQCAVVAMLACMEAAAACRGAGSTMTCTAEPGVTGTQWAWRVETSNAPIGATRERYRVDGAGYTYTLGTDAEGRRWASAKRKPAGSAFLLRDDGDAPATVPPPLPVGAAARD